MALERNSIARKRVTQVAYINDLPDTHPLKTTRDIASVAIACDVAVVGIRIFCAVRYCYDCHSLFVASRQQYSAEHDEEKQCTFHDLSLPHWLPMRNYTRPDLHSFPI